MFQSTVVSVPLDTHPAPHSAEGVLSRRRQQPWLFPGSPPWELLDSPHTHFPPNPKAVRFAKNPSLPVEKYSIYRTQSEDSLLIVPHRLTRPFLQKNKNMFVLERIKLVLIVPIWIYDYGVSFKFLTDLSFLLCLNISCNVINIIV